jgi:hypothetical protein
MVRWTLPICIVLLAWLNHARADGISKSYSDWTIDGNKAELRVSFSPHDFATWLPQMDTNHDLKIDTVELEPRKGDVGRMVVDNTALSTGGARDDPKETCIAGAPRVIAVGEPPQEVQVQVRYACPKRIVALAITANYLPGIEPPHVGVATVSARTITAQHVFTRTAPIFTLELQPVPLHQELFEQALRGARSNASIELAVFLVLMGAFVPFRDSLLRATAFLGTFVIACFVEASSAHRMVTAGQVGAAIAVGFAGGTLMIPLERRWVRVAAALSAGVVPFAVCFAVLAMSHQSASSTVVSRAAFVMGALAPVIACSGVSRMVSRIGGEATPRIRSALGIAAILAMVVSMTFSVQ